MVAEAAQQWRRQRRTPVPAPLRAWVPLLMGLLGLAACTRLPDYALPQLQTMEGPVGEVVPYRTLTREDFRADALHGVEAENRSHLNALSRIQIRPALSTRIRVTSSSYQGRELFFGTVVGLKFEAVFIPEHSYWNPAVPAERQGYVLEHEQIHFALMELAARRLTRMLADDRPGLPVVEYSVREARLSVEQWLSDAISEHQEAILAEHGRFDRDASLYYAPKMQRRWWRHVRQQLDDTAPSP